jgi:hypothetical protein
MVEAQITDKKHSIRGDAHPLVSRFKNPNPKSPPLKGFVTLGEAKDYMAEE